ncbi:hypothetical protein ND16A_2494 [Thalassotalea sp. ND16A]|nr:hypothetical protein ND16A_2494 [Thalassotalea sp. ND16A]
MEPLPTATKKLKQVNSADIRNHSKCSISVGIKMPLGKENNVNIVTLCLHYLPQHKVILTPS